MDKRVKIISMSVILGSSLFLGGCSMVAQPANTVTETPTTKITGKIMVAGDVVSITSSGKVTEITSRKIDLKQYKDKEVTLTGEFSGTTLFVDEVK